MNALWILGMLVLASARISKGVPVDNSTEGPTEPQSCHEGENFPCGAVITENGTIMHYNSENSSQEYPHEGCVWTIKAPEGTYIELENVCMLPLDTDNDTCKPCIEEDVGGSVVTHTKSCPFWMFGSGTTYSTEVNITISFWRDYQDSDDLAEEQPSCYAKDWSFSLKAKFHEDPNYVFTTPKPTTTTLPETTTSSAQIVYLSVLLNLLCLLMTLSFY